VFPDIVAACGLVGVPGKRNPARLVGYEVGNSYTCHSERSEESAWSQSIRPGACGFFAALRM